MALFKPPSSDVPRSEVYVDTGNGHGSGATKIRRFTNSRKNTGAAITWSDDATNGSFFTINEDGIYSVSYTDSKSTAAVFIAITVSVSSTTTNANALTYANGRRLGVSTVAATATGCASWTGFIAAGSIVRAQDDGTADASDAFCSFSIVKVSN